MFGTAQILVAAGAVLLATTVLALLAFALASHGVHAYRAAERAAGDVYSCVALVPALVLVRHVLDVGAGAPTAQHVLWAITVSLAAAVALLAAAGADRGPRLVAGDRRVGVAVVLLGPPLGFAGYTAAPAAADAAFAGLTPAAATLIVAAVGAEEMLFRGPLQHTLAGATGRAVAVALTSVLFALTYLDVAPPAYAATVAGGGLLLSLAVAAGAPVLAAVATRMLLTLTLLALWPYLLA